MSRGSSSLGGGGFSGGGHHSGSSGIHHGHSSNGGLLTGLVIGSLLSRGNGSSGGSEGNYERPDPTQGGKYKRVKNTKATYITSAIFLALTIMFIVFAVMFRFDAVYTQINATATDYDYKNGYYYTSYDFDINGTHYSVESKVGWTKLENMEGKTYTEENIQNYYLNKEYAIYYKNSDPYTIYEVEAKSDMPTSSGIYIFFAVATGIVAIAIFAGGLYKYELDPEYEARQREIERNKPVDGKRKCNYCNSLIDEKADKCPNCGASQK